MNTKKNSMREKTKFKDVDVFEFLGLSSEDQKEIKQKVELSNLLRKLRGFLGLTQVKAAELIGESQPRIAKLEAASHEVSVAAIERALISLGMTVRVEHQMMIELCFLIESHGDKWRTLCLSTDTEVVDSDVECAFMKCRDLAMSVYREKLNKGENVGAIKSEPSDWERFEAKWSNATIDESGSCWRDITSCPASYQERLIAVKVSVPMGVPLGGQTSERSDCEPEILAVM